VHERSCVPQAALPLPLQEEGAEHKRLRAIWSYAIAPGG
jgi:hypothetical protein